MEQIGVKSISLSLSLSLIYLKAKKGATLHQVKRDSVNGGSDHLILDEVCGGAEVVACGVDALWLWNAMVA